MLELYYEGDTALLVEVRAFFEECGFTGEAWGRLCDELHALMPVTPTSTSTVRLLQHPGDLDADSNPTEAATCARVVRPVTPNGSTPDAVQIATLTRSWLAETDDPIGAAELVPQDGTISVQASGRSIALLGSGGSGRHLPHIHGRTPATIHRKCRRAASSSGPRYRGMLKCPHWWIVEIRYPKTTRRFSTS